LPNHRQTTGKPLPNQAGVVLLIRQAEWRNYFSILTVQNTDFGVVAFEYESPQVWLIGVWFQLLAIDTQDLG